MSVSDSGIIERFGPPVAVPHGRTCEEAQLHQQWSTETHEHARMYALLRLHLRYDGDLTVSTIHEPTDECDIIGRFAVTLLDLFGRGGTGDPTETQLAISTDTYPAIRCRIKPHFDARLDGIAAHIPDQARTVVVIAPPAQLDGIRLEWLPPRAPAA